MERRWLLAEPPSEEMRQRFPELHPVAVQLLWNRHLTSQESVDEFLMPDYGQDLHDPFLFRDMERACERVWRAVERRERVVVYGDYDADGVTGSVLLMTVLRSLATKLGSDPALIRNYIPHREKEGYGLRREAIEAIAAEGAELLITVDCGISNAAEVALAREKGMDAIVVDHHQVPEKLPEAILVHPLVPGETYPYKYLAAVGVAFKFACGLIAYAARRGAAYEPGFEKWLLDLVAIATVTDFMPLVGENRTLERYGLIVLNKTRRVGLRKLIEAAGLKAGTLDTVSVGYAIGPRINAASRMDHARLAYETLMAETTEDAASFADKLNRLNADRQRYTEEVMREARSAMADEAADKSIRLVAGDGWSAGIVGLVAGKLVSELGRPVIVFGKEGERYVGSGRGIPGFNLVAAMEAAKKTLTRYGGHPQACGLTIDGDGNFRQFCAIVEEFAARELGGQDLRPALAIDAALRLSQVTWDLVDWLAKFEPHGEGNPRPRFLLEGLLVSAVEPVGKDGRHARISVRGDTPKESKIIAFNMREAAQAVLPGGCLDAVVEIGVNVWNGHRSIQLKAVDIRPSPAEKNLQGYELTGKKTKELMTPVSQ